MTVSRVLSGGKNVRPQLRERVERAVAELGYHRNQNARTVRLGQRSGLVGVIIANVANPYYAEMLLGVEEVASSHERRILVGNTNEDVELETQLASDFISRQVEGLIVVPAGENSERWKPGRLGGVSLVFASRAMPELIADTVLVDDVSGAYQATMVLLNEGHRRIAFLGNRVSVFTGQRRFEGFQMAHERFQIKPVDALIRRGQQDIESAENAMAELLELDQPPTAVFSANNRNTVGAIRAISAFVKRGVAADGVNPALGVRLFGFDSFEFADMSPIPLSIVDHDARELGRRAAEMLFERLEGKAPRNQPRIVELPIRLKYLPEPS